MRTTPQSPRSRFPKGQPRQSGNHAPNPHPRRPPPPHRIPHSPTSVIPAKAGIQRGAARGVSVLHRTPHHQHPPPPRTPHRRTGESRYSEGRGAAHPHRNPHRVPHSPSHARSPSPFALSLSKPVLRALEGGPPPPTPPAAPHPPIVVPAKAGIQRGAGRRTPTQTTVASPTPRAVREPPVPPQRDPHPSPTSSPRNSPHPPP